MQISDMLGKYGQNLISNTTATEQAAKMGTQQLTNALSSLSVGNIFEGTVKSISNQQVLLILGNGESVTARMEGKIDVPLNSPMFFEVKENSESKIAIKPYMNGNSSNVTLMKALNQAGIGVTDRNLQMVKSMMEQQMPIDKNHLNEMLKSIASYPKTDPAVLVQMTKLNIPLTEGNIQQFLNYQANAGQIMSDLGQVADQLPQAILQGSDSMEQAVDLNAKLMQVLFGSSEGETQAAQIPQNGQNIQTSQAVQVVQNAEGNVQQAVFPVFEDADGIMKSQMPQEQQSMQISQTMQETQATQENVLTAERPIQQLLGQESTAKLQAQMEAMGIKDASQLLEQTPEEFVKKLSAELQNMQGADADIFDKSSLEKLLGGKEYKSILQEAVSRQWLLEPSEVENKDAIKELYDKIQEQMKNIEHVVKQSGIQHEGLQKATANVQNNLDFMHNINQMFQYVQLPLKMHGQNANGDLYVYTNKKAMMDEDGELSAFLHLDMDHLGSTDVSVKMKGTDVKTNFYMADDASYQLIMEHAEELVQKIQNKGYTCQIDVINESKQVDFVEDFLKQDAPPTGKVFRYSFDVRA